MTGFPVQVFPRFIQEHIASLNQSLNFHPDFLSAAVMFSVASATGNKYKLRVKHGWETAPIFWFACVGMPGTIKTHPIKTIVRPIQKIDAISKSLFDEEMKHYNPDAKPRQTKPVFKQTLISDYTIEALHMVHGFNKRGLGLYKDELNGFLKDMNKYRKGSDLEFWLESFNNGSYIVNRVMKDPILIDHICINIIGTIQHEVLSQVIQEYSGNGFVDRFLFTAPESQVYTLNDLEPDAEASQKWADFINHLNEKNRYFDENNTELLRMDSEAFKKYQQIDSRYVDIQKDPEENTNIKNYLSKMKTYVPRFALILCLMESTLTGNHPLVTERHMEDAGIIADYFIETARDVFSNNDVRVEIQNLMQSMKTFTRNEKIKYLHSKNYSQTDIGKFFGISRQMVSRVIK